MLGIGNDVDDLICCYMIMYVNVYDDSRQLIERETYRGVPWIPGARGKHDIGTASASDNILRSA